MTPRSLLVTVGVINLVSGVVIGVGVARCVWPGTHPALGNPAYPPPVQLLGAHLDLEADQCEEVNAIFEEAHPRFEAAMAPVHSEVWALKLELLERVSEVLTPEQQERLGELRARMEASEGR